MLRLSLGARYMILSALSFSLMSLFVRIAASRLPTQEIVLFRGLVSLALSYVMLKAAGVDHWGNRKGWLLVRGALGFVALSCFYHSLAELPFAEANLLQLTSPAWTALFAAVFLRESVGAKVIVATAASFVGIVLVSKPAFLFGEAQALPVVDVGIAVVGAVFAGAAYTVVRYLRSSEDPLVIVFYFPLVAVPLSVPTVAPSFVVPEGLEWLALLGVGLTTQLGQVFMTRALATEKAAAVTAIGYVQVLFAALWGALFFAEVPDAIAAMGALVILIATLALSLGKKSNQNK